MYKGKFSVRNTKGLAVLVLLALILGVAAGGTVAWLVASTGEVKNTFTTSDISIELDETKTEYKMIPGHTIAKDPKVTVTAGSEACWLFVKIEKSANFDTYMTYGVAEGWTELTGETGVYYREVTAEGIGTAFSVLKNDQVTVKETVTKQEMETAKNNQPTLTFTAYASQLNKTNGTAFTAAEAWENVN